MPAPTTSKAAARAAHVSKPKKKTPLSEAENLRRLFKTLCAQLDGGHNASAIKTCDKILRLSPADPDALQTKLFLLLTTDRPTEAIALIEALSGEKDKENAPQYAFERAYALYELQQRDEARALLAKLDTSSEEADGRGARHLEAQLNYREGAYQVTLDIYNELLDSAPTAEEHADILTNIRAASTHLDFINTTFLQSLDALPAGVRTGIEDAPPPAPASSATSASISAPAPKSMPTTTTATTKKKKLPPGVIPGVSPPPDPERWLKKSERTGFATRRRKGGGGATQGFSTDGGVVASAGASGGGGGGGAGAAKGKGKKRK